MSATLLPPAAALSLPTEALAALMAQIVPVCTEPVPWLRAAGRLLAEPLRLDRPSPACDVSAMDGYAVRLTELAAGELPIAGELQAGRQAPPLPLGAALRVFTGAMVPPGTEAILPREQLREEPARILLPAGLPVRPGQHIRRQGENGLAGTLLAAPGTPITAPMLTAIASCGYSHVSVYRRLRVGLLITGGEVCAVDDSPAPWCLRDGNGPAVTGLLAGIPWLDLLPPCHVPDDAGAIAATMANLIASCDALIVTGGVSAGDYDHVPAVLRQLGHRIVFHHLAIRPGKPVLGAVTAAGCPILALPGNPVSAMVTARSLAIPALARRAGHARLPAPEFVTVADTTAAPARLTWFPLVRLTAPGHAELLPGKGSGDWVAAAASDGFIEIPPGSPASGLRRLYRWTTSA